MGTRGVFAAHHWGHAGLQWVHGLWGCDCLFHTRHKASLPPRHHTDHDVGSAVTYQQRQLHLFKQALFRYRSEHGHLSQHRTMSMESSNGYGEEKEDGPLGNVVGDDSKGFNGGDDDGAGGRKANSKKNRKKKKTKKGGKRRSHASIIIIVAE